MRQPPVRGQPAGANRPVKAVILLVTATLFFASQDALTKHLVQTLPVPQIVTVRYFFFALFALGYVYRQPGVKVAFAARRPGLQVFRALLIAGEITVFAYAIRFLGLAEIHAIMACFPLLATALSVPILGESVGWRRWLAVFVGFIGTLIILRPGSAVFQPAMAIALTSALMFALYNVLTRKVAGDDSFATSLLYVGVVGFLGAAVFAPFHWRPVNPAEAAWLLLISCTSIIGHLLLIKALALAPAVILQPFHYFMLVWATVIAFLVYGEVLSPATLSGAAIVVGSGVFIAWREYRLMRGARTDDSAGRLPV
ncbi:MAG: DMT family transporter [Gammaproteobacteria bacterium]|nr:DMT family transporter [Gammaproteobacteria bacterium]MDD9875285.1 DMT family transporter [Gammaproteobacteria bacterium]